MRRAGAPTSTASPSGDAIIGKKLFGSTLEGECLYRVQLHGAHAGPPKGLYCGRWDRLRAAAEAPDGSLWITTSNQDGCGTPRPGDDRVIRIPVSG